MREILFRGKPLGNLHGKFIYGSLGVIDTDLCAIYHCFEFNDDEMQLVDIGTVGQYTGLTDKNGEKIFEGDIIKQINSYDNLEIIGVVRFSKSSQFVISHTYTEKENYYKSGMKKAFAIKTNCEIIGNIYDNPELLEA
jgi:uncharacterized phage protein (TIGR01671 family)